jgi:glycosyltransferase involved in cell wall biosynthesis
MSIRIIVHSKEGGIYIDAQIYASILPNSYIVVKGERDTKRAAWNVYIEHLHDIEKKDAFPAQSRAFMVNQEMLCDWDLKYIKSMNVILCKTKLAKRIMGAHHAKCVYTSFTSMLPRNVEAVRYAVRPTIFVHLAGSSPMKNTDVVIKAWRVVEANMPDAKLFITSRPLNNKFAPLKLHADAKRDTFFNIVDTMRYGNAYMCEFVSSEKLAQIMSMSHVYVCPSAAEGWGHYLNDGRLARRLVITTDAPPMNELITEKTGILVAPTSQKISIKKLMKLSWLVDSIGYRVNQRALSAALIRAYSMKKDEYSRLTGAAYDAAMLDVAHMKKSTKAALSLA